MDVRALDRRSIGQVTHNTTPIHLRVSGNHSDMILFLLIKSPPFPVVLGFSWLQRHNPLIDWSAGAVIGWSPFCHAHLPGASEVASDLSAIPAEYQDLRWVISKACRSGPFAPSVDYRPLPAFDLSLACPCFKKKRLFLQHCLHLGHA
jgi:hypothetical protein